MKKLTKIGGEVFENLRGTISIPPISPIDIGNTPSVLYTTFAEISMGEFELRNFYLGRALKYVLVLNQGCGRETVVSQGTVDPADGNTLTPNQRPYTNIIFKNLECGEYTLKIEIHGLPEKWEIEFSSYAELEELIIESVQDLFSHCVNCGEEVDILCLMTNLNSFMYLSGISMPPSLMQSHRCSLTQRACCGVGEERLGQGNCKKEALEVIALQYKMMYQGRSFEGKDEKYDYQNISNYIAAKL